MGAQIQILENDIFFNDSPNAGEPDCKCSRCHTVIGAHEDVYRHACDASSVIARDNETGEQFDVEDAVSGLEFRLCELCQRTIGLVRINNN